jgi:hypothetical protein
MKIKGSNWCGKQASRFGASIRSRMKLLMLGIISGHQRSSAVWPELSRLMDDRKSWPLAANHAEGCHLIDDKKPRGLTGLCHLMDDR